jgi:putative transposase
MPNHVHVLIEPLACANLGSIVHSWKSYTSKLIRREVSNVDFLEDHVWQADYYDRYMRNAEHYAATVEYIHQNPVKAGLVARAVDWPWSSAAKWERGRLGR